MYWPEIRPEHGGGVKLLRYVSKHEQTAANTAVYGCINAPALYKARTYRELLNRVVSRGWGAVRSNAPPYEMR